MRYQAALRPDSTARRAREGHFGAIGSLRGPDWGCQARQKQAKWLTVQAFTRKAV
ncbi:hypothetical protein [Deinococcus sp. Arct2-2]|uniref:hypothetical protein n=1 Tax=Deinococcus sp. Arct2-2 TaxID=2568653 RepID=UPI001454D185|nr:hypothetical protein [Deinococcus sp. Arct2-2]